MPESSAPFLKLDVQGLEGAVLDGAANRLYALAGLQIEISLVPLYDGALTLREMLDRTEALGMTLVYVEPGFTDPGTDEMLQMEGVFLRPDPG